MLFSKEAVATADRFTSLVEGALNECGILPEDRRGYVLGWIYGQLRKHGSPKQVRAAIESVVESCERQLAVLEKHSR